MVPALDDQQPLFVLVVEARAHRRSAAIGGRRVLHHRLRQAHGRGHRRLLVGEVDHAAIENRAQRIGIDDARQALDDGLGQQVLAREFAERLATDRLRAGRRQQRRAVECVTQHVLVQFVVVLQVALVPAVPDLVERRLGDVDVTAFDQIGHLPVEEREQQRADVAAVDVGVGHHDDAVIAQLADVVVRADVGAQRGDQRGDLLRRDQLVEARLLDVEHLAAQRQDRLELAIAPLLGRAARRIALDDEDLRERRILLLAVGQLARQPDAVEQPLAARHLARLARGLARARRVDDLAADGLRVDRFLEQVLVERVGHDLLDRGPCLGRHQLVLGLAGELGVGHLDRQHAGQALAHVVAAGLDFGLLREFVLLDVLVDDARHRRAQPGEVRATVALRDVVGEAEHLFGVAVVPLHRHFDEHALVLAADLHFDLARGVKNVRVNGGAGLVDVLDEAAHPAREREILLLALALVDEPDAHAVVQEAQLAQPLAENLVVKLDVAEDRLVGEEVHFGAAQLRVADDAHRRDLDAVLRLDHALVHQAMAEFGEVDLAVAPDGEAQPLRQRIHARDAHAVQATRHLVAVLVELAAGVKLRHRDLGRAAPGVVPVVPLDARGDAAAVVDHRNRVVGVDRDDDLVAVAGERFVDRVVDDLEHHVVQAGAVGGVADVHPRALANRLEALEDLDRGRVVLPFRFGHCLPQMRIGITTYLNCPSPGTVSSALVPASPKSMQMDSDFRFPSTSCR